MFARIAIALVMLLAPLGALAQTADGDAPQSAGWVKALNEGWNNAASTWDRIRTGGAGDNSGTISNTGIQKTQTYLYNGSAGNLVPWNTFGVAGDANGGGNGSWVGTSIYNGATWDRMRSVGGVANVGTGVARTQVEAGYTSSLNVTAATTIKATAGRLFRISVVVAGAVGQVCDVNGACAAANVVGTIPAAVGVYDFNWPMAAGIRIEPGAAQIVAVSWQ